MPQRPWTCVAPLPACPKPTAPRWRARKFPHSPRSGRWASCSVENWPDEWAAPRDKEAAQWLDDALEHIVALTEDDTGKPEVCMYSEDGPPSTSKARVEAFGEAIWAVYDLRQLWKSM